MSLVSFTRKRGQAHALSPETRAALNAKSDAEIEAGAASDPDNPPVSDERLSRMVMAREVRRIREASQLSQVQFATAYRIGVGRLRDWEQGRSAPDLPLLVFLRLIEENPQDAAKRVAEVERAYAAA